MGDDFGFWFIVQSCYIVLLVLYRNFMTKSSGERLGCCVLCEGGVMW